MFKYSMHLARQFLLFIFLSAMSTAGLAKASVCKPEEIKASELYSLDIYRPQTSENILKVLLLPPTGGKNAADIHLAEQLCLSGYQVQILDYIQDVADTNDIDVHEKINQSILRLIDEHLRTQDGSFVIVGSSLGGIYASMAYGASKSSMSLQFPALKKLKGAILTVAGGSIAEILASSDIASAKEQRRVRYPLLGVSDAAGYQKILSAHIQTDSLTLTDPKERQHILFFSCHNDTTVPSKTQDALWRAWGSPERKIHNFGHMWTIAYTYFFEIDAMRSFLASMSREILDSKTRF